MTRFESIAIVGVGLIGASIGLAVKRRSVAAEVVGIGRRSASLRKAKQVGAVDRTTTDLERGVRQAQLVIVCTPVAQIAELVARAARAAPEEAILTDAGSTKAGIVRAVESEIGRTARFIGSHPMAGSDKTGPEHAAADLLDGRIVVLTPTARSHAAAVDVLREFWTSLGARVIDMPPAEHDRAVAQTSHLPHLIAAALAHATSPELRPLIGNGWLDTTRIAGGDPQLWQQIFMANRTNVLLSLARAERSLAQLRSALDSGDAGRLESLLEEAKRNRDALGS